MDLSCSLAWFNIRPGSPGTFLCIQLEGDSGAELEGLSISSGLGTPQDPAGEGGRLDPA